MQPDLKDVHPSSTSSLATFAWRRHCYTLRDQYWVLCCDQYSVLFHLFAGGRLCYAARATRISSLNWAECMQRVSTCTWWTVVVVVNSCVSCMCVWLIQCLSVVCLSVCIVDTLRAIITDVTHYNTAWRFNASQASKQLLSLQHAFIATS